MKVIRVKGGRALRGQVCVGGSKNASLPLMVSCLLSQGENHLYDIPSLVDIDLMADLLRGIGAEVLVEGRLMKIRVIDESQNEVPYDLARKIRASICLLGPLIVRRGFAKIPLPGGCLIGSRPVDLHLKGLKALGTQIKISDGFIIAHANGLKGAKINLEGLFGSSVLGTANTLMAATLAEGETTINGAASEPEVVDLCLFLQKNGACIRGIGTGCLKIKGVKELRASSHTVIPDRIEAGTLMFATIATQGDVTIQGVLPEHSRSVIDVMESLGQDVTVHSSSIRVTSRYPIKPISVRTGSYPGFPTDLQAQLMAVLCLANGVSEVKENIYPERFFHVKQLCRLGATITYSNAKACITGQGLDCLSGTRVQVSDLRAGAALILAGLVASGTTCIEQIGHLDRGYENLEWKLRSLGAVIERVYEEVVL